MGGVGVAKALLGLMKKVFRLATPTATTLAGEQRIHGLSRITATLYAIPATPDGLAKTEKTIRPSK